jgi:transposase IS66 family protein
VRQDPQATAPAGTAAGAVSYGPNLQAWCVFLMVAHAIPVHRCAELIESLTGAKPSPGFVHGMIARAAAVAAANKLIRALIILAHVICADQTPIRAGPGPKSRKRYLLAACTRLLTYHFPRRPQPADLRRVRAAGPGRRGGCPRPLSELRRPPRADPPTVLPAPIARPG